MYLVLIHAFVNSHWTVIVHSSVVYFVLHVSAPFPVE